MKAFLSKPFGRVFDVPESLRTKSYLTVAAVAEAEKILAVSERATDVPAGHCHSPKPAYLWTQHEQFTALCLAESLAAWIES